MSQKRTRLLEEMFVSFATAEDKKAVDLLYSQHRKGVATALMLRRVHKKFFELMGSGLRENSVFSFPDREIVINDWRNKVG